MKKSQKSGFFVPAELPGARAGSSCATFGIKGRKTGKIFGPGLDFRILKAYITRMQELLQLERRKD
jgi:hypothetical protein